MALLRNIESMKSQLDKIGDYVKKFQVSTEDVTKLEVRLKGLDKLMADFTLEKGRLFPLLKDKDVEEFELLCEEFFEQAFDVESDIVSKIKVVIPVKAESSSGMSSPTATIIASHQSKLPDIPLPSFSGKYDEWLDFKHQFEAIIKRNDKLTEHDKLNYLRGCLTGDAVRDYGKDESSFVLLWKALTKTFENKRWLVSKHVRDIFDLRKLSAPSAESLNGLILSVQRHLRALRAIKLEQNSMSEAILIEYLFSKLDPETQKDWEATLSLKSPEVVDELPTWDEFVNFLTNRVRMLQRVNMDQGSRTSQPQYRSKSQGHFGQSSGRSGPVSHVVSKNDAGRKIQCFLCFSSHYLNQCPAFKHMADIEKRETVKRLNLCENCLSNKHELEQCTSSSNCRYCQQRHHSSLHSGHVHLNTSPSTPLPVPIVAVSMSSKPNDLAAPAECFSPLPKINLQSPPQSSGLGEGFAGQEVSEALLSNLTKPKMKLLLNTSLIWVESGQGKLYKIRAVLDSCSMSNFMTQACAKRLGLRRRRAYTSVGGICGTSSVVKDALVANVSNKTNSYVAQVDCYVVDKITADLPLSGFEYENWPIPENCTLADSTFNVTAPIDVLIGMEHWNDIFLDKSIRLGEGLPVLRSTVFGWVVGGPLVEETNNFMPVNCVAITIPLEHRTCHFSKKLGELSFEAKSDKPETKFTEKLIKLANECDLRNISSNLELLAGGAAEEQQEDDCKDRTLRLNWQPQSDFFVNPDKIMSNMLCSVSKISHYAQTTIPRLKLSSLSLLAYSIKSVEAHFLNDMTDTIFISDITSAITWDKSVYQKLYDVNNLFYNPDFVFEATPDWFIKIPVKKYVKLPDMLCSFVSATDNSNTAATVLQMSLPKVVQLANNLAYPEKPKSGQVCINANLLTISIILDRSETTDSMSNMEVVSPFKTLLNF